MAIGRGPRLSASGGNSAGSRRVWLADVCCPGSPGDWAAALVGQRIALPTHHLASSHAFVDAALLGLGWGMNPEPLVRDHIASGRLVPLAPDKPLDTALYWQSSRLTARVLAPLTRAIRSAAESVLRPIA